LEGDKEGEINKVKDIRCSDNEQHAGIPFYPWRNYFKRYYDFDFFVFPFSN
jgi:hypothetical protein